MTATPTDHRSALIEKEHTAVYIAIRTAQTLAEESKLVDVSDFLPRLDEAQTEVAHSLASYHYDWIEDSASFIDHKIDEIHDQLEDAFQAHRAAEVERHGHR